MDLRPGATVAGRYVLEGRLASGGMAEVHLARMRLPGGAARRVVVKRLHPHLAADPAFGELFLEEVRLASGLAHPGLVPLLDALRSDDELLLVLDHVPGWDLGAILAAARSRGVRVPVAAALEVATEAASVLAYVHDATDDGGKPLGIVHRDVSPSNLLVAEDGSLRLLDFGVAKATARRRETVGAGLKGKLAYMAPEQARGEAVDARTDLYGLGLVLFELLAGAPAVEGADEVALLEAARAPRIPPLGTVATGLDPALAATIDRLLRPSPADRFGSAREFLGALEAVEGERSAAALRTFVREVIGCSARAPAATGALERALAQVAGLPEGPATEKRPVAQEWSVPAEAGAADDDGAVEPAPRRWPRRAVAAAGLAAIVGFGWWVAGRGAEAPAGGETAPAVVAAPALPAPEPPPEPPAPEAVPAPAVGAEAGPVEGPTTSVRRPKARPRGTLDVSSTYWARVLVGGKVLAESTPAMGLSLPEGRHQVVLENPELGLRAVRDVEIRAGERTVLVVRF